MTGSVRLAGATARRRLPGWPDPPPRAAETLAPDLEDILSERPPWLLRGPHYLAVAMLLLLGLIASVLKVDIIVAAGGRLVADAPPIVLQPLERSVIRDIRVRPGDTVRKGEVLARLDPTFTQADRASLAAQEGALQAQLRRLDAELGDTPLTAADGTPDALLQLTLYRQRRSQYAARLDGLDEDIKRSETALHATDDSRDLLARQLALAREVEAMRARLMQLQTGSRLTYLEAQAMRMHAEHDYQEQAGRAVELQHALGAARAARQVFIDEWRRDTLEDLARTRADLSRVTEGLAKAVRLDDLEVLSAPQDGIVLDVAKRSNGSVLHEAEPLITLIPLDTPLIAEVMIDSGDVGYPKRGDAVEVKVDAFPYQRHGMLHGRLRSIGEDSFSAQGSVPGAPAAGGVYHRSQVSLDQTALRNLPDGSHLIPGMTVTAEIRVGTRTLLSYFVYPLRQGLHDSLREP